MNYNKYKSISMLLSLIISLSKISLLMNEFNLGLKSKFSLLFNVKFLFI